MTQYQYSRYKLLQIKKHRPQEESTIPKLTSKKCSLKSTTMNKAIKETCVKRQDAEKGRTEVSK